MNIVVEFCLVLCRVIWAIVLAGTRWFVPPKEKTVVGQVCVITGAGSGLGRHLAQEFARRGATVVLWDINPETNEETAEIVRTIYREISGLVTGVAGDASLIQAQVYTYLCDVSKREQVYLTADKVQCEVGNIDILVNSAGVVSGQHLLECPDELLEHTMMVNCHAHFWTTKAFLPKMLELNRGHIVTVASSHGLFTTAGVEDYCASKFGAIGFHESLSHELKAIDKDGIKMTLVCPFLFDGNMLNGSQIRKNIFFPKLKAEQCVQQAMRAILTDQSMICTPRSMYMASFIKTFLPFEAIVCLYQFFGAEKRMYHFNTHQIKAINNDEAVQQTPIQQLSLEEKDC
ncbi:hypothetical protein DPEC_G00064660 [Dallia pectoralis]|uniref:Uncharacterized protein n=1 Tax=Dallia pectoralis TaxID=75939 RepID=A0ACC2H8R6_DALPE|nr:hypothetical protein DPEC_G00064660 [Dallia pectoralis]